MTNWTDDELRRVGGATELELASARADGTLRPPVTMWVVRAADELYVRSAYGPENPQDPNRPASAVQEIVDTLLRGRLGFKGVVITDNLQSIAIETLTTPAAAGVVALGAGCDLLLYSSGAGGSEDALAAVVKAVKQEKLSREQVQDSYDRITALKSLLAAASSE